jgi:hypothetical protein
LSGAIGLTVFGIGLRFASLADAIPVDIAWLSIHARSKPSLQQPDSL